MSLKTRVKNLEAALPAPEDKDEIERQRWFSEWQESQRREREANRAAWLAALPAEEREDEEHYRALRDQVQKEAEERECPGNADPNAHAMLWLTHYDSWENEASRRFETENGRPRKEPHIAEHEWRAERRRRGHV